jgi:hypothetical protein
MNLRNFRKMALHSTFEPLECLITKVTVPCYPKERRNCVLERRSQATRKRSVHSTPVKRKQSGSGWSVPQSPSSARLQSDTTGTPLQQWIDVLLNVCISIVRVYTNGSRMRCRWWRCKGLRQCIYMRW